MAGQAVGSAEADELTVRFLCRYRTWHRGDAAGFPRAFAEDLIRARIAVDIRTAPGPAPRMPYAPCVCAALIRK